MLRQDNCILVVHMQRTAEWQQHFRCTRVAVSSLIQEWNDFLSSVVAPSCSKTLIHNWAVSKVNTVTHEYTQFVLHFLRLQLVLYVSAHYFQSFSSSFLLQCFCHFLTFLKQIHERLRKVYDGSVAAINLLFWKCVFFSSVTLDLIVLLWHTCLRKDVWTYLLFLNWFDLENVGQNHTVSVTSV